MSTYTTEVVWVKGAQEDPTKKKEVEDLVRELNAEIKSHGLPEGIQSLKIIKDDDAAQA